MSFQKNTQKKIFVNLGQADFIDMISKAGTRKNTDRLTSSKLKISLKDPIKKIKDWEKISAKHTADK